MIKTSCIVVITFLGLCHNLQGQASDTSSTEEGWNYIETSFKKIDWSANTICEIGDLEFPDIYGQLNSIAQDQFERLAVVQKLKSLQFTITSWGRGNWTEGPRFISFTMSNGQCDCQVDKLYYSTPVKKKYKVTERIKCKPTVIKQ